MDRKRYWAFLSYSHQDMQVCDWLHRALETFNVPRRLVGRECPVGAVPSRLFPIFRDRDELPGSAELGKNLTEALAQSRYLIVICSPAAARSRWVNEEIRAFKAMGGESRVLALIVDGEPNAADKPGSGLLECFPEALRYRVTDNGALGDERLEPIAADIRKGQETRAMALLRLVAGLLGLPFDELRQRDQERRRKSLALRVAALSTLTCLLAAGAFWAYRQDRMDRLEELGRQAMMQEQPVNAAVFLAETYRMGNDSSDVRIMLEQAMRSVDMLSAIHADDPDGILATTFSDDGTRVLATSKGGNISVWRSDNGHRLLRIAAANGENRKGVFLPGGREIALLYDDGRIEIIDGKLAKPTRRAQHAPGAAPRVWHVAPDARFVASDTAASAATVVHDLQQLTQARSITPACREHAWSDDTFHCLHPGDAGRDVLSSYSLAGDGGPQRLPTAAKVHRFAADPAGRRAALALASGEVSIIDLQTGKLLAQVQHPGGVELLKFSTDGQALATAGWAGSVLVWASASGKLLSNMAAHVGRVRDFHFLPDSKRLVTLGEDGALKIWSAQTGTVLSVAQASHGFLTATALSPNGRQLATFARADGFLNLASENLDPALKVWNLDETGPSASVGNGIAAAAAFLDESRSKVLFSGTARPSSLWDTGSGAKLSELPAYGGSGVVSFNPDGQAVATPLGVFDVATGRQQLAFDQHPKSPCCVAWSRDGKLVASSSEYRVRIWELAGKTLVRELQVEGSYPTADFSLDGSRIAVLSNQGATLYDVDTGGAVAVYRNPLGLAWGIEASPDGKRFRIGTSDAMIDIDAFSARELQRVSGGSVASSIGACRQRVSFLSRGDRSIVVSSLHSGLVTATLSAHDTALSTLDCDATLQFYLTGGRSGSAILWNANTSKPLMRFSAHLPQRLDVGFLPGTGQVLIAAARDGIATKWTFEEERRMPATVARRIACRVPLALDGYTLQPKAIDRAACLRERAW